MNGAARIERLNELARCVATWFEPWVLLAIRWYVAWQFLKSGWLKLTTWDTTLYLFQEEYHVPVLPPVVAAIAGTTGELLFPSLLVVGLLSRYAAAGLSFVNVMAVVSYAHVLLSAGFEAALGQHYLWGTMLVVLAVFGPGRWSLDEYLRRRQS